MEKLICSKCQNFCGFIGKEKGKLTVPALPDNCPFVGQFGWKEPSQNAIDHCPVAKEIEKLAPGSMLAATKEELVILSREIPLTFRQRQNRKKARQ